MKKVISLLAAFALVFCLFSCGGSEIAVDYENVADFEAALNAGDDLSGKTVTFTVNEFVPDSAFGYNIQAGEHLNFCSEKNPGVKTGDTVTVEVVEVASVLGSYVITYEIVK